MLVTLAQDGGGADTYLYLGFILFTVALVLLFVELLVPSGGLIGALCGVAVIGSVVSFYKYNPTWGLASLLTYMVGGPILLIFVFKLWLHSPLASRMILGAELDSHMGDDPDALAAAEKARRERLAQLQELIGAEGVTVTALRPVGIVKINGQRVDALAETGVIPADTPVVVMDVYDNQIKVRPS